MTQSKKPQPKASEEEPLKGEALKERAAELDVSGRSSMTADELREAVAEEEGAPKTETPETKVEAPDERTPRDEEAPLETPEEPRVETRVISQEEIAAFGPFEAKPPKPAAQVPPATTEVAELYKHVADNPVDSHAPTWLPRQPNSP